MAREVTVTIQTSSAGVSVDLGDTRTVTLYRDGDPVPGGGGGVTDHGALTGLADDDHTQYALADGTRGNFASAAQGALADTATQPGDLGNSAGLDVGTTAGTVAAGDDSRLSDARTPTSHAASHASGGGDALTGLATSQMPKVSDGDAISGTTHTVTDSDAGLSRECTGASCQLSFGDAISLDGSGQFRRMSQGGAITWTATGSVAIQIASGLAGATSSGVAPAYVNWHCVDDNGTKVIILSGDLV